MTQDIRSHSPQSDADRPRLSALAARFIRHLTLEVREAPPQVHARLRAVTRPSGPLDMLRASIMPGGTKPPYWFGDVEEGRFELLRRSWYSRGQASVVLHGTIADAPAGTVLHLIIRPAAGMWVSGAIVILMLAGGLLGTLTGAFVEGALSPGSIALAGLAALVLTGMLTILQSAIDRAERMFRQALGLDASHRPDERLS